MSKMMSTMDNKELVHFAAAHGQLNALKWYMSRRTEEEVESMISATTNSCTPLAVACANGHVAVAEYLLDECGAEVERGGDDDGPAPLWFAARAGHLHVVQSLLNRGADINCSTPCCPTPLIQACVCNDLRTLKYLVETGADVEAVDDHGATALMQACHRGHHDMAEYLIQNGAHVTKTDNQGGSALHYSVDASNFFCVTLLLSYGAKIREISSKLTPLLLVKRSARPPNETYLIILPFCHRFPLGELTSVGASYVDTFRRNRNPINYRLMSVERDQEGVYWTTVGEQTNFHRRSEAYNAHTRMDAIQISKPTVDHAAVPGFTCYHAYKRSIIVDTRCMARKNSMWNLSLELYRLDSTPDSIITQRCLYSLDTMFSDMIVEAHQRDPPYEVVLVVFIVALREVRANATDDTGSELVHNVLVSTVNIMFSLVHLRLTMSLQHWNLFRRVAGDLVRLNPVGRRGWTPLHVACSSVRSKVATWFEVVRLLLDVGANPRLVDYNCDSPLHLVAMSRTVRHDLIQLLLSRGAHFDTRNTDGQRFTHLLPPGERQRYKPMDYVSLQCLAATQLFNTDLANDPALPPHIKQLIDLH